MTKRYATLSEMQDHLEFGVTGTIRVIDGTTFELLEGHNRYEDDDVVLWGWAALHLNEKDEMVDWDRVDEDEARELGLIK